MTGDIGVGNSTILRANGTAHFGGNITSDAAPSHNTHLVNKLYADNLVAGVDLSGIATNAAAIAALTNGAPELLNTITELADALGDDENFATTITGLVSTESTARTSADTALSGRLDVLEADPTTATAVSTEASARTSADSALSGRLDVLEADPTTQTLLTAEATSRTSADTALSGRLDTLEADPTTATAVTSAIATETSARQAADALLLPLAGGTMSGAINLGVSSNDSVTFVRSALVNGEYENNIHINFENSGYDNVIQIHSSIGSSWASGLTISGSNNGAQYAGITGVDANGVTTITTNKKYVRITNTTSADYANDTLTITLMPSSHYDSAVYETRNHVFADLNGYFTDPVIRTGTLSTAGGAASVLGVDGTATFGGNITASAVPSDGAHLVNKLYADSLVAGVDLSGIATNAAAISAETTARTSADSALSGRLDTLEADPTTQTLLTAEATSRTSADTALSGRLDTLEADPTTQTLLTAEATARANAITALTTGAVAQNTAAIAAEVNTDRDAAITAAIAALTAGAVAQNAADILQEISDRQTAVAAETSARQTAVSSLQSSITTTNANVSNNAQAITTEETARVAADAGKVDKASSVNVNLVGETSAASAPVDAQGADNFLFLVVDKATGAIKSIEKSFLEAE